jgi:GNAT superfamily N-acetyltransferase
MKLLNKAYDTVYKSSFPMADERETKADLQQYTKDGDTIVTLIGEKLDSAKPVIKGISVMYPYPDEDKKQYIGLLGYLAVGEKYRKEGLGHTLFDVSRMDIADRAKAEGLKLAAMVHECNPVGTKNDNMDPAKRMAMYERWGCIKVPFPYSQQPLTADGESVPLVLMAEPDPKTGKYPSKQAIKDYLYAMADEAASNAGQGPADKNKLYLDMVKALDQFDAKVGLDKYYAQTLATRQAALTGKFNEPAWKDAAQPASSAQQKAAIAVAPAARAKKAKVSVPAH